jgi:hypothetical protein
MVRGHLELFYAEADLEINVPTGVRCKSCGAGTILARAEKQEGAEESTSHTPTVILYYCGNCKVCYFCIPFKKLRASTEIILGKIARGEYEVVSEEDKMETAQAARTA